MRRIFRDPGGGVDQVDAGFCHCKLSPVAEDRQRLTEGVGHRRSSTAHRIVLCSPSSNQTAFRSCSSLEEKRITRTLNNNKIPMSIARGKKPLARHTSTARIRLARISRVSETARWKRCMPYWKLPGTLRSIARPLSESVQAGLLLHALHVFACAR